MDRFRSVPRPAAPTACHYAGWIRLLALGSLLVLVGCAGYAGAANGNGAAKRDGTRPESSAGPRGTSSSPSTRSGAGNQGYAIRVTDTFRYEPAMLTVPKGSTVVWTNVGQIAHTVTDDPALVADRANSVLPAGVQPWDSGDIPTGGTFAYTFAVPGRYVYFCKPHETLGQVATIIVTD